jgi:hypothetical protein
MICYLFTAVGFPPGGSRRETCTEIRDRQLCTKRETIHKTIQNHKTHKIGNKSTKQNTKLKKNIQKHKSSIWKIPARNNY